MGRCARRRAAREATWVDCCEVAAGHQLAVAVQSWRAEGRAQAPPARRRCCCGRGLRPDGRSAYAAKGLPAGRLGLAGNLVGADLLLTHGLQRRRRLGVVQVENCAWDEWVRCRWLATVPPAQGADVHAKCVGAQRGCVAQTRLKLVGIQRCAAENLMVLG